MQQIEINEQKYEIIYSDKKDLDIEELKEKITDYFDDFDYIFGDYCLEKVRLKGFREKLLSLWSKNIFIKKSTVKLL